MSILKLIDGINGRIWIWLGLSGFGLVRGVSKEWLSEALDQIVQCNVGANSTE